MKKILIAIFAIMLSLSVSAKSITLTEDNTAVLRSAFTASSVTTLKKDLLKLNANLKSGYPIYLVLFTPGGEIQKGFELFEFIKGLNRPVHTITIFAASMGFQTVQHLGTRYILNYGVLMSHLPRGGSRGEYGGTGMPSKRKNYDRLWERRQDMMDLQTVKRSGGKQTIESYRKDYIFDLWLNGPEAVKQGYADEVATVSCSTALSEKTKEQVFQFGFFKVYVNFSACPLITSPLSVRASLLTNKGYVDSEEFLEQNGKFGKRCKETGTKAEKDYYGNVTPATLPQLCAYDKKMTLKSLKKQLKEQEDFLNRDLRNHVQYSY